MAIIQQSVSSERRAPVSVIVVNWNRRDLLRACLASLEGQTVSGFEVVLVDNGSTDGSVAMAEREFGAGRRFELKLVRNERNLGFCAGNNQGIRASGAPLVAVLNNDAEAGARWIESLLGVFDDTSVGMAASKIVVWEDPGRIDKAGHLIYPDGQNRGRGSGQRDRGQFDSIEEVLWPDGCAAMYRRAMLDEIGGFDEDLFAYGDDAELGMRARIAGWRCLYVPEAVVRHHRGATFGLGSARRIELIERNRVLLAAKLFPWSLLWLNGAYYLARITAGVLASIRQRGEARRFVGLKGRATLALAMIRGDLAALRLLPRFLGKRKELRRIRKLSSRQIKALVMRHRISLKELSEEAI